MPQYNNVQVKIVSEELQEYMQNNKIDCMTANECATFLAKDNILQNNIGPVPGFNFRQMLREGRDGHINLVQGAKQKRPYTRWYIYKI